MDVVDAMMFYIYSICLLGQKNVHICTKLWKVRKGLVTFGIV